MQHYEYSVQSSLIQHGMSRDEMNNVEHVQDIRELEYLLNDNLAKQRVNELFFLHFGEMSFVFVCKFLV